MSLIRDVWKVIIGYLSDMKDILSLSKTCKDTNEAIKSYRNIKIRNTNLTTLLSFLRTYNITEIDVVVYSELSSELLILENLHVLKRLKYLKIVGIFKSKNLIRDIISYLPSNLDLSLIWSDDKLYSEWIDYYHQINNNMFIMCIGSISFKLINDILTDYSQNRIYRKKEEKDIMRKLSSKCIATDIPWILKPFIHYRNRCPFCFANIKCSNIDEYKSNMLFNKLEPILIIK